MVYYRYLTKSVNVVRRQGELTQIEVTLDNNQDAVKAARKATSANMQTSLNQLRATPLIYSTADFIVDMPFSTWDKLFAELQKVSVPKRKTYARVFCYLYYWAMRFNGTFTHSREQIMEEIHIQNNLFTEATVWLEDHNLLTRSGYLVVNTNRQARGYSFDESLWSGAAKNNQFYH